MAMKQPKVTKIGFRYETQVDPELVKAAIAASAMVILSMLFGTRGQPIIYRMYGPKDSGIPSWQPSWLYGPGSREIDDADQMALTVIGEELGLGLRDGIPHTDIIKSLKAKPGLVMGTTKDLKTLVEAVMADADIVAHYAHDLIIQATRRDVCPEGIVIPRVVSNPE